MAEIANDKILPEIREIKSDLQSLKKQGNNANANREVSSGGRKFPRETQYGGKGCSTCKEQKIGGTYQHLHAVSLAILRQSARKIWRVRETSTGNPAVGTGSSRKVNIPPV